MTPNLPAAPAAPAQPAIIADDCGILTVHCDYSHDDWAGLAPDLPGWAYLSVHQDGVTDQPAHIRLNRATATAMRDWLNAMLGEG